MLCFAVGGGGRRSIQSNSKNLPISPLLDKAQFPKVDDSSETPGLPAEANMSC